MRILHSSIARALVTLAVSGCFQGAGSGLIGVSGDGGNTVTTAPVLGFFVQPNSSNVGQVISPAVEVVARDSLSGTTGVRPVNGIASFTNLVIDKAGTYTLQASASGAATVTSTAFSITAP